MTYIPSGGGASNLATSGDVALSNPKDGDTLIFDGAVGKWKNVTLESGVGLVGYREYINGIWQERGATVAGAMILWIKRDSLVPNPPIDSSHFMEGVDVLIEAYAFTGGETSGSTGFSRTVDDIVYDHFGSPLRTDGLFPEYGKHEGLLGGVNMSFDWYHGSKVNVGPPYPNGGRTHHNIWGQIVVLGPSTPERRVRAQIDIPETWHLVNGTWILRKSKEQVGNFEGGFYRGSDFISTLAMTSAHFRQEATGGHSLDLLPITNSDGTPHAQQTFAHWFYSGYYPRVELVTGTTAVAIVTRMRLITDTAGVDVGQAKFTGCIGGDLYGGATDSGGVANAGFSIPRHKFLTAEWKSFTDVTGTESQIRSYPSMPFLV